VKSGPAARNSFSRMLGSWFGIASPTGYEVGREFTLSHKSEFTTETKHWCLTYRPSYEVFGYRPAQRLSFARGPASENPQGKNPRIRRGAERELQSMAIWALGMGLARDGCGRAAECIALMGTNEALFSRPEAVVSRDRHATEPLFGRFVRAAPWPAQGDR
jgi:hypothetical protein